MKKKLQKIKEESQALCTEISNDLRQISKDIEDIPTAPFKTLDDFDKWFYSDKPLVL